MTITGGVIHHHEDKIITGAYARIENFGVKRKHAGGFQKSNIPFVILVLQNTRVIVLSDFESEMIPIFHTKICIRDLKKRIDEKFLMATYSAIVVDVQGHYKSANNEEYC